MKGHRGKYSGMQATPARIGNEKKHIISVKGDFSEEHETYSIQ